MPAVASRPLFTVLMVALVVGQQNISYTYSACAMVFLDAFYQIITYPN